MQSVDPEIQRALGAQGQNSGTNPFAIPDLSETFPGLPGLSDLPGIAGAHAGVGPTINVTSDTPFTPLSINKLEKMGIQADTLGYQLSDKDFANRFPDLVAGRNSNVKSAALNLSGQEDPFMLSALKEAGLGDVDFGTGEYTQARNLGVPILAKEARDRAYFQTLLADNPQRSFGLNAGDVARIALANTQGQNALALGLAQGRTNQALADISSQAAAQAGGIASLGQLATAGIKAIPTNSFVSPTLQPQYYSTPGYDAFQYQIPAGTFPGENFGYGDPYSGNYYDASGNYVGNAFGG